MNRLKFEKFGWNQVETVNDINLYDYVKNRMIFALYFLIISLMSFLLLWWNKFNLSLVSSILIIFSIVYILISYEIIKKHYLFWYTISCILPFVLIFFTILFLLIQMNAVTASFYFFVIYILIFILSHIFLNGFNKDEVTKMDKSSARLLVIPIGAASAYFVSHTDNNSILMFLFLAGGTFMAVYNYYEMKYILKNHKDYK